MYAAPVRRAMRRAGWRGVGLAWHACQAPKTRRPIEGQNPVLQYGCLSRCRTNSCHAAPAANRGSGKRARVARAWSARPPSRRQIPGRRWPGSQVARVAGGPSRGGPPRRSAGGALPQKPPRTAAPAHARVCTVAVWRRRGRPEHEAVGVPAVGFGGLCDLPIGRQSTTQRPITHAALALGGP
jgi:hypothetical protein